jgi:hypothetical protein
MNSQQFDPSTHCNVRQNVWSKHQQGPQCSVSRCGERKRVRTEIPTAVVMKVITSGISDLQWNTWRYIPQDKLFCEMKFVKVSEEYWPYRVHVIVGGVMWFVQDQLCSSSWFHIWVFWILVSPGNLLRKEDLGEFSCLNKRYISDRPKRSNLRMLIVIHSIKAMQSF